LWVAWLLAFAAPLSAGDAPTYEFVFEADLTVLAERADGEVELDAAMQSTITILERRLNGLDGSYRLTHQGRGRLLVQMTAIDAPHIIRDMVGITGVLQFLLIDPDASAEQNARGIARPGSAIYPMKDGLPSIAVRLEGGVSGDNLTNALQGIDPFTDEAVVNLQFDAKGAQQFAALTSANVGKQLAIVLDGKVLSAPTIVQPILGGQVQISGSFTLDRAQQLAIALRSGALPTPLRLVEERVISATH
jgi:preprotein translocase subunit SecD